MMFYAGFLLGLAGSMHCIAMCGPIATSIPRSTTGRYSVLTDGLLYCVGKTLTYSILGFLIGTGLSFTVPGSASVLISGIASVLMIATAVLQVVYHRALFPRMNRGIMRFSSTILRSLLVRRSRSNVFLIGLVNGIIPCGMIVSALAGAAALHDVWSSTLFMATFGIGTSLALLCVSLSVHMVILKRIPHSNLVAPALAIVSALFILFRTLSPALIINTDPSASTSPRTCGCETVHH